LEHAAPLVHVPLELQVCGVLLGPHCTWSGAHTPWQLPAEQVWLTQAVGTHVPVPSHVSALLPWQVTEPEAQTPSHTPPTHVESTHATGLSSSPLALQAWVLLPEHVDVPGTQEPVHWPLVPPSPSVHTLEHGEGVPHEPCALHVATLSPWHVV
jgi:hypothetical protein